MFVLLNSDFNGVLGTYHKVFDMITKVKEIARVAVPFFLTPTHYLRA